MWVYAGAQFSIKHYNNNKKKMFKRAWRNRVKMRTGKSRGKLCIKSCIIEQQHFKGGETLFKRTQKDFFERQLLYCSLNEKRKVNERI